MLKSKIEHISIIFLILCLGLLILNLSSPTAEAAEGVRLFINSREISADPAPMIRDSRTMVPLRLISENLGAEVEWSETDRSVKVSKDGSTALLWIDNKLFCSSDKESVFGISDTAPLIYNDRTFVPLRLVANILGIYVDWEAETRTVFVDSERSAGFLEIYQTTINNIKENQIISGTTLLSAYSKEATELGANEIRFYLFEPLSGEGKVIARGNDINATYTWKPDPLLHGTKVIAAAFYSGQGVLLSGGVVPVVMKVTPMVRLVGVAEGQKINGTVSLSFESNMAVEYVKYEFVQEGKVSKTLSSETDPYGTYLWTPQLGDNGVVSVRAIAYDHQGNAYEGSPVSLTVNVPREMQLKGITSSYAGQQPLTLWVSRNFLVSSVEYIIKNVQTGIEEKIPNSSGLLSAWWFPGPEKAGTWDMIARVTDTSGKTYDTGAIRFTLPKTALINLAGIGPKAVLTGEVKLKAQYNTPLNRVDYYLINKITGQKERIGGGNDPSIEYSWIPLEKHNGSWLIQATGIQNNGAEVSSPSLEIQVYTGKLYGPVPIIEKSKFQEFAAVMAVESREKTGMSAALQTAQAILETGWGQSTPVDKYTGQISKNLFGIKGSGPAGSVTSNTWEEYNGVSYRIDAEFRAYNDPQESWADHKDLLLTRDRYSPFREVMHDSTQGAWALRRCGYATDSKYPLKLIDIIKRYGLEALDNAKI